MFCYQCEQTAKGTGCTVAGVCGKKADVAALQDMLVYVLKGLSVAAVAARDKGVDVSEANHFTVRAMFTTLTNVNFDPSDIAKFIHKAVALRDKLKQAAGGCDQCNSGPAAVTVEADLEKLEEQATAYGVFSDAEPDENIKSLKETVVYGLKGVCAYVDHAAILGQEDEELYANIHKMLATTLRTDMDLGQWVEMTLETGRLNIRAMELLDAGNTTTFGHPEPTEVPLGHKKGKAICVSGHDLKDLHDLLVQTEGKDITVYTHGEMLPCHGYPGLKKFDHFYGHYGTAWQNQHKEFEEFPGPILMTTNCIQKPRDSYVANIFTTGLVGFPGVTYVENGDFGPVIEKALEMDGFAEDEDKDTVMTGFARNAVLGVADKVIQGVKGGDIRHFFLVAGCDGAKPGRNYYTEFVEQVPEDCIVLTLACGKFRFFDKKLGDIGGIPRLLDVGQCNDAYSAVKIAMALAEAFDCEVNELPLSMVLSWYEQKAVAILLSLLALGIKDIRLGPSLPAFLTPDVLDFLVQNYDIKPISTPEEDLQAILG